MFSGDPRLILTERGSRLQFVCGQPLMDKGVENLVLISLFTNEGWCGNALMKSSIGSGFAEACNQPITRQSLQQIRMEAERALIDPALGRVTVTVTNPAAHNLRVHIAIEPPAADAAELVLTRNAGNWEMQSKDPAHLRVRDQRWRKPLLLERDALRDENGVRLEF